MIACRHSTVNDERSAENTVLDRTSFLDVQLPIDVARDCLCSCTKAIAFRQKISICTVCVVVRSRVPVVLMFANGYDWVGQRASHMRDR